MKNLLSIAFFASSIITSTIAMAEETQTDSKTDRETYSLGELSHIGTPEAFGKLEIQAAIDNLPKTSDKPLAVANLLDNGYLGVRVFRVYKPVARHHHNYSSTYLKIISGRALFSINGGEPFEAGSEEMVFWERGVDHEVVKIIEHPLTFLAIDTPTRREKDVHFFNSTH